jgi:hypothetical protein
VRIELSPAARASARRYMADQAGMRAIGAAVASLADNPLPADGFHAGEYHRLRVGRLAAGRLRERAEQQSWLQLGRPNRSRVGLARDPPRAGRLGEVGVPVLHRCRRTRRIQRRPDRMFRK